MPLNCQTSRTGLQPRAFHILHTSDATLKSPYGLRPTPQPVPNRRPRSTPDRGASHPGRRLPDPPPKNRPTAPTSPPSAMKQASSAATPSDTPNQPWPHVADNYSPTGHNGYNASSQRGNPLQYRSRIRMKTPTNRRKSCTNRAQIPRIARSILAITFL